MQLYRLASVVLVLMAACTPSGPAASPSEASPPVSTGTPSAFLPNPASVYCEEQGNVSEIRTAADGSQSGVCILPDGRECDEWAYFRGECGLTAPPTTAPLPTPAGGYTGWQSYNHPDPPFSFFYPPEWIVEPDSNPVSTLYGQALFVHPAAETERVSLRVVFRPAGDGLLLWPTGTGEGEFVERGTLPFGDGTLKRVALVCEGRDQSVWYRNANDGAARLGDLEFSFILSVQGACIEGLSLSAEMQALGDMLVASFQR